MNAQIKTWVRSQLANACVKFYGMNINMDTNLNASLGEEIQTLEGRVLKWAIRDSKVHEPWDFSITIAMSLAATGKGSSEEIAETLSRYLTEESDGPWNFINMKGYINAYFSPQCLSDYFEGKEEINWEVLRKLKGGAYAYYRLTVIGQALEARGLSLPEGQMLKCFLKEHPLSLLFNYPEKSPANWVEGVPLWEKWLEDVGEMTRLGYLRNLNREMEEILLTFIKACLD